MSEEWTRILEYPDYAVSDLGRVMRLSNRTCAKAGTILKQAWRGGRTGRQYLCVCLCRNGKRKTVSVHILVAEAFLGARPAGCNPNHVDANRANNSATNLEWLSQSQNVQHAYDLGLRDCRGEGNGQAKLTAEVVVALRAAPQRALRGFYARAAREHGVSSATVRDAVLGKTWSHL